MEKGIIKGFLIGGIVFGLLAFGTAKLITSIDQTAQDGDTITATAWNELVDRLQTCESGNGGGGDTTPPEATALVPTLSSNTGTNGSAFSRANYGETYAEYKAFDSDDVTYYHAQPTSTKSIINYLGYQFNEAKVVNRVTFKTGSPHYADWRIQGGNGSAWTDLYVGGLPSSNDVDISFSNTTAYTHYRLYVNSTSSATLNHFATNSMQFYGY